MTRTICYTGPSMNPLLRTGDGLEVIPYEGNPMNIGDVVVFCHPEEKYQIVHRVVAITSEGIRTRGDNNNSLDPWVVQPEDIIGRVVSAKRKTKQKTIHGGSRGRMLALALLFRKKAHITTSKLLHSPYHSLSGSGIFRHFVPLLPKMRILTFRRSGGDELQLFMGNKIIGRCVPGSNQWQIMRPFRLFVDEAYLNSNGTGLKDYEHSQVKG